MEEEFLNCIEFDPKICAQRTLDATKLNSKIQIIIAQNSF